MLEMFKVLGFPKMFFSFGDQDGDGGGQGSGNDDGDAGNDDGGAKGDDGQAADFIDIGEVKVPKEALEKYAKETYKDRFDAFDNMEKWQAKFTQEAQLNSQFRRKAADYDRLVASQSQGQPTNEKDQYVSQMTQRYPDLSRQFLEDQFQWMQKLSGQQAQQSLKPFMTQWGAQQEQDFMNRHKDVIPGSPEAMQIADMIDQGYKPDIAYNEIMGWANPEKRKVLIEKENQEAIKRRDEENRLKLKRQRTGGTGSGKKKDPESFDETFEDVYAESQQDR